MIWLKKLSEFFKIKKKKCTIHEVNYKTNKVAVHCVGFENCIHIHMEDLISSELLVDSLPSEQCAWIGYIYGSSDQDKNLHKKNILSSSSIRRNKSDRFDILGIKRNKKIILRDKKTNEIVSFTSREIMMSKKILCLLSPSQALYIGINSGRSKCLIKVMEDRKENTQPNLKIVSRN